MQFKKTIIRQKKEFNKVKSKVYKITVKLTRLKCGLKLRFIKPKDRK